MDQNGRQPEGQARAGYGADNDADYRAGHRYAATAPSGGEEEFFQLGLVEAGFLEAKTKHNRKNNRDDTGAGDGHAVYADEKDQKNHGEKQIDLSDAGEEVGHLRALQAV
ncbi:hypothetical protein SDC9_196373 [bioreactor metagenome]|uniref:Uncharacterized protein n=1 Tax=bioreactor metagenome TaxID=1076179 RepID=A0A645IBN2_9ZZZZ